MVVLDPKGVTLGGTALTGVRMISVDRGAGLLLEEWTDGGSFCKFVDVPEVRVKVKIVRYVDSDELEPAVLPGDLATLEFVASANASGAGGQRIEVSCACAGVTHEVPGGETASGGSGSRSRGAMQTIELRGVSLDEIVDPVTITTDEGV